MGSRLFGLFRTLYLAGLPFIASMYLQVLVIILIHRLRICEFTYLLKFICDPHINIVCTFSHSSTCAICEKFELPNMHVPR